MIEGYLSTDEIRGLVFPDKNVNTREAILVAVSALEKGNDDGSLGTD